MFEQYKIDPWFQLFAKQRMAERKHRFEWGLKDSRAVMVGIRQRRKEYLGSDLGLTMFIHEDGKPLENVVEALSGYLGSIAAYFLETDYHYPDTENLCIGFFYYSMQLYAYNRVGRDSFDDLIRLAELFQSDIDVFNTLLEQNLLKEIIDDWMEFLTENYYVPCNFSDAVTGAVAVFLGVLKDPTCDAS